MADQRTSVGQGIVPIWPRRLVSPARPPALVYLDLNHWINLAKSSLGRGTTQYGELLQSLRGARANGSVRLVLSTAFVEEFSAIKNPRQREEMVALMEELTDFDYLAGLADVFRLELQAFFDAKFGDIRPDLFTVPLVGKSMLHAFGRVGGLKVFDEATGEDVTEVARATAFRGDAEWLAKLERRAERELLTGPRDDEIDGLRSKGYEPERSRVSHRANVAIEQHFADHLLDTHWRKGRLLDVVAARHVSLELIDMLSEELVYRDLKLQDVTARCKHNLEFPLSMPASAVFVGLKTQYHRDAGRKWTTNDLHDIAALAVAIPYCDIVFTDASIRNAAVTAGLDKLKGTKIPRTPGGLVELLDQLPPA